jgi:hypothetical protein
MPSGTLTTGGIPGWSYTVQEAGLSSHWTLFHFTNSPRITIVRIPYWILLPPAAAFAFLASTPTSFSLRTLFIATTLLALVLGLIAWTSS